MNKYSVGEVIEGYKLAKMGRYAYSSSRAGAWELEKMSIEMIELIQ